MRIGIGLGTGQGGGAVAVELEPPQTDLSDWWRSGYGVTTGTGGVSTWTSQISPNRTVSQSTTTQRPDLITSDPNVNNLDTIDFTAANVDILSGDDAASTWDFLWKAAGAATYVLFRPTANLTQGIVGTRYVGTGIAILRNTTERSYGFVEDGDGDQAVTSPANDCAPNDEVAIAGLRSADGASPEIELHTYTTSAGDTTATDAIVTWTDTGSTEWELTMGARRPSGTNPFDGQIVEVLIYSARPDDTKHAEIMTYLKSLAGLS